MGKRKAEGDAPKSSKKEKTDDDDEGTPPKTYAERLKALSKISTPLADEKLTKAKTKTVVDFMRERLERQPKRTAPLTEEEQVEYEKAERLFRYDSLNEHS